MTKEEKQTRVEELQARVAELEACDNEEEYDAMLDDVYGEVTVAGYTMSSSKVLASCDPIAYRCGHSDFNDSLLTDVQQELDDALEEETEE